MTELARRIGPTGAVAIGVTSMIGAGLFVAFAPAAAAAGSALLVALGVVGVVAACNAVSSARLAVRDPRSGGTYVYATTQLSPAAGHLAGWAFLLGKTASCAAMALAIGLYLTPDHARLAGSVAIVIVTVVNLLGVQRSTQAMVIVGSVVVATVVVACVVLLAGDTESTTPLPDPSTAGVLEGAALLFFAFAGYARLSTLGEEVREPRRTIPRAVAASVVIVGALYVLTAVALVGSLGGALGTSSAPFTDALDSRDGLRRTVAVVAVVAAAGALLSLCLGVSRTTLAMARDRHLPSRLAAINTRGVPWVAELTVAAAALVALWSLDLAATIGFSSCCVLLYYALANASAWTLGTAGGRLIAGVGFMGCTVLAFSVPIATWAVAVGMLGVASLTRSRSVEQRRDAEHEPDQTQHEGDRRDT